MTNLHAVLGVCLVVLVPSFSRVGAQPMGAGGGPPMGGAPFLEHVFPPNLIMRYDADIGLTDDQRKTIAKQIEDAHKTLVTLQWDVERESQKLGKLLEGSRIDEASALAQADQVMKAEQQLKRAHLMLLIRIKNELTPAQQEKLRELRPEHHRGPRHAD